MTKPPARIASLLSSATEILYGIGVADRVVAVSHECDFPPEVADKPRVTFARVDSTQSSSAIDSQVKQQLASGEPLYEVDWALLRSLQPNLIVTQAQCDVCAVRYQDVVDTVRSEPSLRKTDIVALNPNSLDDVIHDIQRIGECVGRRPAAARFVHKLRERVRRVVEATSSLPADQRPRVACIEWVQPIMLAGNWMPELIEMAGGRCGLSERGVHSAYASWAEVLAYDPQVIVVSPCGFDLARSLQESETLKRIPGWHDTVAARTGRVFAVDGNAYFNRSGPRLVDSLEILAHLFHPLRCGIPLQTEQWDQAVAFIDP